MGYIGLVPRQSLGTRENPSLPVESCQIDQPRLAWRAAGLLRGDRRPGSAGLDVGRLEGGSLEVDVPRTKRPCPNEQDDPDAHQGCLGVHFNPGEGTANSRGSQVAVRYAQPKRLPSAVGERAPEPFGRPKLVSVEPPFAETDLHALGQEVKFGCDEQIYVESVTSMEVDAVTVFGVALQPRTRAAPK